jgi:hypothetical protein
MKCDFYAPTSSFERSQPSTTKQTGSEKTYLINIETYEKSNYHESMFPFNTRTGVSKTR